MKILFAEDDVISYQILKKYLEKWNYDFIGVTNGIDAYNLLRNINGPKLAILDWMMPGMNGVDICKKLQIRPSEHRIHIILITSKTDDNSIVKGLNSGASDFVSKPYEPMILKARIKAGMRIIEMDKKLLEYSKEMELIAENRAKQLIHADRLSNIGILSSGMAHEINNPTSFISVNIQLLEDFWEPIKKTIKSAPDSESKTIAENISEEMPNIISDMKNGVKRIKRIVGSLKKFYKSDPNIKKEICNIADIVDESIKLCVGKIKKEIDVVINIPEDTPKIFVNSQEIEQVVVNMLINSADALELQQNKQIMINVQSDEKWQNISIKDTGSGISQKDINNIFKPFFTTKGKSEGTGLGLSISQNIISNHNGNILVNRIDSGGMEFIIQLPTIHKSE